MTAAQYLAKRESLTRLVALEMWLPRVIVGQASKGNYLLLNHMKVHSPAEYFKFENEIWRPMAEQWVKEGSQAGWQFSTLAAPSGTDVKYTAISADIYPTLEAALKQRSLQEIFKKAHPDKDYQQTVGGMGKLRDLAQRDPAVRRRTGHKKVDILQLDPPGRPIPSPFAAAWVSGS